jgi:hypothetical protein
MKSVFTLNPFIDRMLEASKYDTAKLVNAIQASLNSATVTADKATRGNVKLVSKETLFRFNEGSQTTFEGKTDAPARFARWHDATARVFKVCGEPSDELTVAVLPVSLKTWLDAKFSTEAKPAEPAKGRRNGNVESVPAPAVPK